MQLDRSLARLAGDRLASATTAIVQGTYESPTGLATTLTDSASIGLWSFPWIKGTCEHVQHRP